MMSKKRLDSYSYAATKKRAIKQTIAPNTPHNILILLLSRNYCFMHLQ